MVRRESKWEAVLSWADEVEKEEEVAAAAAQQKQKSDPFASARPREVVLQEKGIDWRKLDANLEQPSRIRLESKNERLNKGSNFPLEAMRLSGTRQNTPSRRLKEKRQEDVELGFRRVPVSPVVLVPPVRYPPKFVGGRLYDDWVSMLALTTTGQQSKSLNESDFGHQNIESINPEKENSFFGYQQNGRKSHNAGIMSVERFCQAREAQHKDRRLQKSASRANQVNADSVLIGKKFHGRKLVDLPLKSEDRRRQSANRREVQNRRDDYTENTM